jgi:hypothetical protein
MHLETSREIRAGGLNQGLLPSSKQIRLLAASSYEKRRVVGGVAEVCSPHHYRFVPVLQCNKNTTEECGIKNYLFRAGIPEGCVCLYRDN